MEMLYNVKLIHFSFQIVRIESVPDPWRSIGKTFMQSYSLFNFKIDILLYNYIPSNKFRMRKKKRHYFS